MRSRYVIFFGVVACVPGLFFAYFELSTRSTWVNSDGASQALQAWDMLHGNLLLHGWALTDVSFYTTELPQYVLIEAVRGLGPGVVHVAAAMTYTLLVALAAWLAAGRATGPAAGRVRLVRALIAAAIMAVPQPGNPTRMLLLSPDHVGTCVPVLATWLIADRGAGLRARVRWLAPAGIGVLLAWTIVGDPLAALIGAVPLVIVCCVRVLRGRAGRYELSVAAAAAAALPAAWVCVRLIAAAGGWTTGPVRTGIASPGQLPDNLLLTGRGLLQLFGADVTGQPTAGQLIFAFAHLAGVALVAWALWLAVRRFGQAELLVQGLVVAIGLNLAGYAFTIQPQNMNSTREIAAVLPFGAVLAGRLLAGRVLTWQLARVLPLAAMSAVYAGMLFVNAIQPPVHSPSVNLASWLAAHDLTQGLAGYWQANVVTLDSRNSVRIRAVTVNDGKLTGQTYWNARQAWYDHARQYADFVISPATNSWRYQRLIIHMEAEAGRPAHIYRVWPYTIAVWHRNLLARLR